MKDKIIKKLKKVADNGSVELAILNDTTEMSDKVAELLEDIKVKREDIEEIIVHGHDGEDGYTPEKGIDYFTPEELTQLKDDVFNRITPPKDGINGQNGKDGLKGTDGYSPIKGVDYFDGIHGYSPIFGVDYFNGKDGSPDTAKQIVEKINDSSFFIDSARIKGFSDLERIATQNSLPITTMFVNGTRAKNISFSGATVSYSGDTAIVAVSSGGVTSLDGMTGDLSFTSADSTILIDDSTPPFINLNVNQVQFYNWSGDHFWTGRGFSVLATREILFAPGKSGMTVKIAAHTDDFTPTAVELFDTGDVNSVQVIAPTILAASWTMTLPVDFTNVDGKFLISDTAGNTSWGIVNVDGVTITGDGTPGNPLVAAGGGSGTVTSVSFTGGLISVATATTTPALTVAGTSGGIPYFSSTSTWASSALLAANALMIGGGAGTAPSTITTGTGVLTALGVNVGSAGAFVTFNGALGTPSSGVATNLTGLPLTSGVTGVLGPANGGTGVANNAAMTVTGSGNFAYTRTLSNTTNATFPAGTFTIAGLGITQTFTGINTFSPAARSSGTASYLTINAAADTGITTTAESKGINIVGATRTWADGTTTTQREYFIGKPTYNKTTTSATFTTASTLYIEGAPVAGTGVTITNGYAAFIDGNNTRIGGTTAQTKNSDVGGIGLEVSGTNNTSGGMNLILSNSSNGTSAFTSLFLQNDISTSAGTHYGNIGMNSSTYTDTAFGTALAVANQLGITNTDGPIMLGAFAAAGYVNIVLGGSATANEVARFTTTGLTVPQVFNTNNAIAASGNAATVTRAFRNNTVTNNSAATLTITLSTSGALTGDMVVVRILDFSAVAQTVAWVNTENSTVTAPVTSNGSTTLPLTVGFMYNSSSSKWRCLASA